MFNKYQHIERLGTQVVAGILDGTCYIFPKIDGTNASVWYENGTLHFGSRNRELSLDNDNCNFMKSMVNDIDIINISAFLSEFKNLVLFGEWLVPHSIKDYRHNAWNKFYIFDVYDAKNNEYLNYEMYSSLLQMYGIDNYIPPICKIDNPSTEKLMQLAKNNYLMENETSIGEGVVIKNYDFVNKYGNNIFAKIVNSEFKDKNLKFQVRIYKEVESIEYKIINKYLTDAFIFKEFYKIAATGWDNAKIPMLFETIYRTLLLEEIYNISKYYKQPKIDLKKLRNLVIKQTKEYLKEVF